MMRVANPYIAAVAAVFAVVSSVPAMAQGRWAPGPEFVDARPGLVAVELGGRVYVAGGPPPARVVAEFVRPDDNLRTPTADLDVYEPEWGDWRERAPAPTPGRSRFGMAASSGELIIAGGLRANGERLADVSTYDPLNDVWRAVAPLPSPRAGLRLVAEGGRVYALGGRTAALDIYDPTADAWTRVETPDALARTGGAAAALDGRIYFVGGVLDGAATARVDVYDIAAERWSRGPDLPSPRAGLALTAHRGRLHAFGGADALGRDVSAAHYAFDPARGAWTSERALPAPRTEAAATSFGESIMVLGGGVGGGALAAFTAVSEVDLFTPEG